MINLFAGVNALKNAGSGLSSFARQPQKLLASTGLSWLSGTTLSRMENRADPFFDCWWTIQMPAIPLAQEVEGLGSKLMGSKLFNKVTSGLGIQSTVNKRLSYFDTNSKVSSLSLGSEYVEEVSLVNRMYDSREVFRAGAMWKYPSQSSTIDDLTIAFYADRDLKSFAYLQNWLDLVMMKSSEGVRSGGWNVPSMYKRTITVGMADENDTNFYLIDYLNCWLKSMDTVQLGANGERVVYQATFSVDDLKVYGYDAVSAMDQLKAFGANKTNLYASKIIKAAKGQGINLQEYANTAREYLNEFK